MSADDQIVFTLPRAGEIAIPDTGYSINVFADRHVWGVGMSMIFGRWDDFGSNDQRFKFQLQLGPIGIDITLYDRSKLR